MGQRRTSHGYPRVKEGKVIDRSYKTIHGSSNKGLSDHILKMVNILNIEDRLEGEKNFQAWKVRIFFYWRRMTSNNMSRLWLQLL
jgi:hypothetical protein